jgi:hypothetical protein
VDFERVWSVIPIPSAVLTRPHPASKQPKKGRARWMSPSGTSSVRVVAGAAISPARKDILSVDGHHTLVKQNWKKAMSDEDLKAELDRPRNENAALKKGASSSVRMKVSEKGAVSIGRFPVTLYKEQWLKLLDMSDEIRAFIAANPTQLKAKD